MSTLQVRVDGPTFARAWLAVSTAASENPDLYHLFRAVEVEVHDQGLRLTSTDGRLLLSAWVPLLEFTGDDADGPTGDTPAPALDVAPRFSVVARDLDHRGRGLLRYALKLLSNFPKEKRASAGLVPLDLTFGAELALPADADTPLDGMAARYLAFSLYEAEIVYVPELLPMTFPDWRRAFESHDPGAALQMAWSPEVLTRVAAVARYVPGEVRWTLAGGEGGVRLTYACLRPVLEGIAMPRRSVDRDTPTVRDPGAWSFDFDGDPDAEPHDFDDGEDDPAA